MKKLILSVMMAGMCAGALADTGPYPGKEVHVQDTSYKARHHPIIKASYNSSYVAKEHKMHHKHYSHKKTVNQDGLIEKPSGM